MTNFKLKALLLLSEPNTVDWVSRNTANELAKAYLEQLRETAYWEDAVKDQAFVRENVEKQNIKMRETLEWYADKFKYYKVSGHEALATEDSGERARKALEET